MKKKKGFTLIELLAVIVILAIIALIATPIILGIIENAKKGSAEASANGYIDALEYHNASLSIDGKELLDGTYDVTTLDIKVDGKKPVYGEVTFKNGSVETLDICINGYIVEHKNNKTKATTTCPNSAEDVVPTLKINDITKTTNSIQINFTAKNLASKIEKTTCEYGLTNEYGSTGKVESITNGPCIIENVNQNTIYYYKITTVDKNKNEKVVKGNTSTAEIVKPVITSDTDWSTSKMVNIEYKGDGIETPAYFLKSTVNTTSDIDVTSCNSTLPKKASECTGTSTKEITKDTWYLVSGTKIDLTLTENGSIYAYTSDGQNLASSNVLTITSIIKNASEVYYNNSTFTNGENISVQEALEDLYSKVA